jgi:hypothetical protein
LLGQQLIDVGLTPIQVEKLANLEGLGADETVDVLGRLGSLEGVKAKDPATSTSKDEWKMKQERHGGHVHAFI